MERDHDEQVEHGDDDPHQLESFSAKQETVVDGDTGHQRQVRARQELEAQQERRERVGDHQREDEGDIGTRDLHVEKHVEAHVGLFLSVAPPLPARVELITTK